METPNAGEWALKIYVASSWRNTYQPSVVEALRSLGHKYDVTIRVSDPSDEETMVEATFRSADREKMLAMPVIGSVVASFEKSIIADDELCESCGEDRAEYETDDMVSLCKKCWDHVRAESCGRGK